MITTALTMTQKVIWIYRRSHAETGKTSCRIYDLDFL